jgi:hypothetical protein
MGSKSIGRQSWLILVTGYNPSVARTKAPCPSRGGCRCLRYAQVVKAYRRRRLVGVTHRVVFGTRLAIEQVLATCGWTINTSFVERLHLDIRQRVAAIGRRVNTLCQASRLAGSATLFQVYHNSCCPRQPTPTPADTSATNGRGSASVAAVYTSDDSGIDRSRVVAQRGAVLPGTTVVATASAVAGWPGRWACKGAGGVCL